MEIFLDVVQEHVHEDFYKYSNPFTGNTEYALGKKKDSFLNEEFPIITFNPISTEASYGDGSINKKCKGPDELKCFIEAIDFLFDTSLIK